MKDTDKLWLNVWSKEKYPSCGELSTKEGMDVGFASFAYAMGRYFGEGVKLLDYGCGPARFCNFMSSRLKDFKYYGIEPNSEYGINCIQKAKEFYKKDRRISLGLIGDDIESESIKEADVALLCSIFTHLTIEQTESILYKLYPIIENDGIIVFSMIIGNEYEICKPGHYSIEETYGIVYNTEEQIRELTRMYDIELKDRWMTPKKHLHSIYVIRG